MKTSHPQSSTSVNECDSATLQLRFLQQAASLYLNIEPVTAAWLQRSFLTTSHAHRIQLPSMIYQHTCPSCSSLLHPGINAVLKTLHLTHTNKKKKKTNSQTETHSKKRENTTKNPKNDEKKKKKVKVIPKSVLVKECLICSYKVPCPMQNRRKLKGTTPTTQHTPCTNPSSLLQKKKNNISSSPSLVSPSLKSLVKKSSSHIKSSSSKVVVTSKDPNNTHHQQSPQSRDHPPPPPIKKKLQNLLKSQKQREKMQPLKLNDFLASLR